MVTFQRYVYWSSNTKLPGGQPRPVRLQRQPAAKVGNGRKWSPHPKGGVSQQKGGSLVDYSWFMLAKLDMLAKLVYNQIDHGLWYIELDYVVSEKKENVLYF